MGACECWWEWAPAPSSAGGSGTLPPSSVCRAGVTSASGGRDPAPSSAGGSGTPPLQVLVGVGPRPHIPFVGKLSTNVKFRVLCLVDNLLRWNRMRLTADWGKSISSNIRRFRGLYGLFPSGSKAGWPLPLKFFEKLTPCYFSQEYFFVMSLKKFFAFQTRNYYWELFLILEEKSSLWQ